jgi:hypothetical protein
MANQEHLDLILQGEPWRRLMKAHLYEDVHLDLRADLAGKNLQEHIS